MHCISLKSVSQYFTSESDRIVLFEDLSLEIESGRSYSIMGPSGAGKSSLLTLLAGLDTPKQGHVEFTIDRQRASQNTLRKRSGFIFQQFHLLSELSVTDNLVLPLRLKGDRDAYDKARVWLKKIGLEKRANHKPSQLSGGEQQRAAIARAFIAEPAFIFADEPTGNLDEKTSQQIAELMFETSLEHHRTIILVTHSSTLAARADCQYQLSKGKLERQS